MSSGARYVFTGCWCTPGLETSWNGSWRASAEHGSATWDGDGEPGIERINQGSGVASPSGAELLGDSIAGSLREFVRALRTGRKPMGEVHDNIFSLAMVEAAIESNAAGARVSLRDNMFVALDRAVMQERRDDVRAVLQSWQRGGGYPG
jgi:predicted dehydrogenase